MGGDQLFLAKQMPYLLQLREDKMNLIEVYRGVLPELTEKTTARASNAYLYLPFRAVFDELPEALQKRFAKRDKVLAFDIDKKTRLANADIKKVRASLLSEGYYLQMPVDDQRLEQQMLRNL